MLFFYNNYTAFLIFRTGSAIVNSTVWPPERISYQFSLQLRREVIALMKFAMGIMKSAGFPLGLLLQILTVVFLVRGNSGYSRSASNWFLLVLGADIGSTLYRVYELITVDFRTVNPFRGDNTFGLNFMLLMWGMRSPDHEFLQNAFCKVFFFLLYIPIFLSPIALTVSSLIRCYCVKFSLRAKTELTTRVDRLLMAGTVFVSIVISIVAAVMLIQGFSYAYPVSVFGLDLYYGQCNFPDYIVVGTSRDLVYWGYVFTLCVVFIICASNIVSSIIIILVLFEAKKNRNSEARDSKAEVRATAMLLGMNITLFVCFFVSRVMLVVSTRINPFDQPVAYAVLERLSTYLFDVPYFTNSLFIVGFSRKFYEFYMPCLANRETKTTSAVTEKTNEEIQLS